MVYDYWHVLTALKAPAGQVLTRNTKHFEPLTRAIGGQAKVEWP